MHKIFRLFSVVSLAFVFGTIATNAQTISKVKADIPFAFSIGKTTLAPGKYNIAVARHSPGTAAITISQGEGSGSWTVLGVVDGDYTNGNAELVFDRYGRERVLRQIALSNNGITIGANASRKRNLASLEKPRTEVVAVTTN